MHSLSEPIDLTCPQCGRVFPAELWLIVDAGERPDLLARARAGALHAVTCPTCGPQGEIDAPLLLYLPGHNPATGQPPLIFSPAEQSSEEEDQQMAAGLLRELAQRLGDAWQDGWLAQVASVRRDLLPVALSDDPAAAMREFLEREGETEEEAADSLPDLLNQFLAAETWDESQRIVEAHPELLSDEADERIALALAEYAGNPDAVQLLTEHRALLRRCRQAGIARSFAEKVLPPEGLAEAERLGLAPEAFLAQVRAASQMPPALREVLAELAATGVEIHTPEDLERALAARPDLRAKLEAVMADDEGPPVPPAFADALRAARLARPSLSPQQPGQRSDHPL